MSITFVQPIDVAGPKFPKPMPSTPEPEKAPRRNSGRGFVTLSELSTALNETVHETSCNQEPKHLQTLLGGLSSNKLDLTNFCRAVRVTLGAGVMMAAVERAKNAKRSPRALWRRGLNYALSAAAMLSLHRRVRVRAARAAAEARLPPIKRLSLRESVSDQSVSKRDRDHSRVSDGASPPMKRLSQRTSVASVSERTDEYEGCDSLR